MIKNLVITIFLIFIIWNGECAEIQRRIRHQRLNHHDHKMRHHLHQNHSENHHRLLVIKKRLFYINFYDFIGWKYHINDAIYIIKMNIIEYRKRRHKWLSFR